MFSENRFNSPTESRRFFGFVAITLFLKLALAFVLPLSADEAYYWAWARHLDHGYFDHPPFVAWLFALGRFLEPFGHAVRWPAVIFGHSVFLIWGSLLLQTLDGRRSLIWFALMVACPLTGIGGIIVTPDLPLIVFWSLAVFFAFRILRSGEGRDFIGLGASLGLGFCSKYHIVLFPLALLPLVFDAEVRKAFLRPGLFLTFLTGLLFSSPVLGWNAANDWVSFLFQLRHGLVAESFSWRWPAEYILGEIILLFPPVLWAVFRTKVTSPIQKILFVTAFVPLGFFLLTAFRAPVELNWPIMAFPAIFALAAVSIGTRALASQAVFWAAAYLFALGSIFVSGGSLHEKLSEPFRFKVVAELPHERAPLFASTYQMASSLWYVSKVPVYKLNGMNRPDMFDRWSASTPSAGTFYLLRETGQPLPPSAQSWIVTALESPAPGLELLEMRAP